MVNIGVVGCGYCGQVRLCQLVADPDMLWSPVTTTDNANINHFIYASFHLFSADYELPEAVIPLSIGRDCFLLPAPAVTPSFLSPMPLRPIPSYTNPA